MLMEFIFEVVLIIVVGTIGVFGNCVLTFMFHKLKGKQVKFHRLMILLTSFDTSYILLSIVLFTIPGISEDYRNFYHPYVVPRAIPMIQVALTGSVYATTAISIERYLIVCRPFWTVSNNWSSKRYIIPILIFSLLYNLPRFFELSTGIECGETIINQYKINDQNELEVLRTDMNSTTSFEGSQASNEDIEKTNMTCIYSIKLTQMRQNKYYYSVYVVGLNFFFMGFIPFLVLVSSASLILHRLISYTSENDHDVSRRSEIFRDPITNVSTTRNEFNYALDNLHPPQNNDLSSGNEPLSPFPRSFTISKRLKTNEIVLAKVSLMITFVFIVCHSIRWVPNIYELIQRIKNPDIDWPSWVEAFTCVSHFLTVLNSSVHFYIYYFTRNKITSRFSRSNNGPHENYKVIYSPTHIRAENITLNAVSPSNYLQLTPRNEDRLSVITCTVSPTE